MFLTIYWKLINGICFFLILKLSEPALFDKTPKFTNELIGGRRNLIHMAVSMCAPQSNRETSPEWLTKLDQIFNSLSFHSNFDIWPDLNKDLAESNTKQSPVLNSATKRNLAFWLVNFHYYLFTFIIIDLHHCF